MITKVSERKKIRFVECNTLVVLDFRSFGIVFDRANDVQRFTVYSGVAYCEDFQEIIDAESDDGEDFHFIEISAHALETIKNVVFAKSRFIDLGELYRLIKQYFYRLLLS